MNEEQNTTGYETQTETKRLSKSKRDRYILGVCGGVAEYFDIDPTIVRVLWVVSIFMGGAGFVAYVVAALLMPKPEGGEHEEEDHADKTGNLRYILSGVLLVLGILFVIDQLQYVNFKEKGWDIIRYVHFPWELIWPLALIALGIYIAVSGPRKDKVLSKIREKNLFRSVTNRKILGVCGGLGEYMGIDPTLVRIIWLLVTLLTGVLFGVIVYIVFALIMPEKKVQAETQPEAPVQEENKDTEPIEPEIHIDDEPEDPGQKTDEQ